MIVEQALSSGDNFIVQYYYPSQDKVLFLGFFSEFYADQPLRFKIGKWKPKCVHQWKTNITEQYQECKNCGIGHAL